MIKQACLIAIAFYQRFLSPIKGYSCAHHRLHQGDTCSNAVKKIVINNHLSDVPNLVRKRFDECKQASITITKNTAQRRADIPCDIPCDISCAGDVGSCGDGGSSSSDCLGELYSLPCDYCVDFGRAKRKTKVAILSVAFLAFLLIAFDYGSRLTYIELTATQSPQSNSLLERLKKRQSPSLRVVLKSDNTSIHTNIFETKNIAPGLKTEPILLKFNSVVDLDSITHMSIQDARFKAASNLVVVGQKLEEIENPQRSGTATLYKYSFKTRWAFLNWW